MVQYSFRYLQDIKKRTLSGPSVSLVLDDVAESSKEDSFRAVLDLDLTVGGHAGVYAGTPEY